MHWRGRKRRGRVLRQEGRMDLNGEVEGKLTLAPTLVKEMRMSSTENADT